MINRINISTARWLLLRLRPVGRNKTAQNEGVEVYLRLFFLHQVPYPVRAKPIFS